MDIAKLILLGLDGCDFKIIKPLISEGKLPTIAKLIKNGVHSNLISTIPFNTLPAWNSLITGVNPGKHGITDFIFREGGQFRVANSSYRMVDTIWTLLTNYGIRQIILGEPVTFPPDSINGIMVTGFSTPYQNNNFVFPDSLKDEINEICSGYEPDLPFGFERIIKQNPKRGLELINESAKQLLKLAIHFGSKYEWDLLAVFFTSTDRLLHFYYNDPIAIQEHFKLVDDLLSSWI